MTENELATALCEAAHPFLRTTGQPVPCATHYRQSRELYVLTRPEGRAMLQVIVGARPDEDAAEHNYGAWSTWHEGSLGSAATWQRTRMCHCGRIDYEATDELPAAVADEELAEPAVMTGT